MIERFSQWADFAKFGAKDAFTLNDRYFFDFNYCHPSKGWQQWDTSQDASYFGIWVHLEKRQILVFAEGDISLETLATADDLRAKLDSMAEHYGPVPPAFISCQTIEPSADGKLKPAGNVQAHYCGRPYPEPAAK